MTKPRNLATLGGGFTQSGAGAIQRSVKNKLRTIKTLPEFADAIDC